VQDFARFAIFGLNTGGPYVLLRLRIIVGFRSAGVINFAHSAFALVAACIYYDFRNRGSSASVAVVLCILSAIVLALIVHLAVIRPLGSASAQIGSPS
jgi:branched-subunit amino acid ABC-type transport system permease component